MKNEYRTDYDGNEVMVLNHDASMTTDISVEEGDISFFSSYDEYDSNYVSFDIKDWEEVKAFIDKKVNKSLGVKKSLLGVTDVPITR